MYTLHFTHHELDNAEKKCLSHDNPQRTMCRCTPLQQQQQQQRVKVDFSRLFFYPRASPFFLPPFGFTAPECALIDYFSCQRAVLLFLIHVICCVRSFLSPLRRDLRARKTLMWENHRTLSFFFSKLQSF